MQRLSRPFAVAQAQVSSLIEVLSAAHFSAVTNSQPDDTARSAEVLI